jgi:hypothetical protein
MIPVTRIWQKRQTKDMVSLVVQALQKPAGCLHSPTFCIVGGYHMRLACSGGRVTRDMVPAEHAACYLTCSYKSSLMCQPTSANMCPSVCTKDQHTSKCVHTSSTYAYAQCNVLSQQPACQHAPTLAMPFAAKRAHALPGHGRCLHKHKRGVFVRVGASFVVQYIPL